MDTSPPPVRTKAKREPRRSTSTFDCIRDAVTILYRIDDFELEHLGSGFFSDVYKVRHRTTNEVLVLKRCKSTSTRAQTLQEVELMKHLSHPNILSFRGVCVHEGQLHPLSEFINGGNLEELLLNTDENLSWSFRFQLSRDIASGMNYLHSKGMIHRDLTAKNCLIRRHDDRSMSAVVADFGLAAKMPRISLAPDGRHVFSIVGTPYSMAPEVLNGERYNEKADVFSYGIILCQIIARISSDPDYMPRTKDFGVDGEVLRSMVQECPSLAWLLAMKCCQMHPQERPDFQCIQRLLDANYHMPNTETPPLPSELNSLRRTAESSDEGGDTEMDGNTSSSHRALGLRRSNSLSSPRTNILTEKNRHKSLTYSPASPQPRPTQQSLPLASQTGSSSSGVHSASDEEDDEDEDPDVAVLQELVRRVDIESPVDERRQQQRRRRRSSSRFATTPVHLSPDQFAQLIRCGSPLSQQVATSAPSSPSSSRRHLLNTEEFRAAIVTSPIATTTAINESSF